jgi:hypothetical protein
VNLVKTPSPMNTLRTLHSATRIGGGGLILIVGGLDQNSNPLSSAELYDPASGTFTTIAAHLSVARYSHGAIMTAGGSILIIGGLGGVGDYLASVEVFTPGQNPAVTGTFTTAAGGLSTARASMNAELLPDGTILVSGGQDSGDAALALAEVYGPGI